MASYCEYLREHPEDTLNKLYHDNEYGFPLDEDAALLERLALEINQAGLSWTLMLKRKDNFHRAFDSFDVDRVAAYGEADVVRLLADAGIIRNRLKVCAVIENARRIQGLRGVFGSFNGWLRHWHDAARLEAHHPLSLEEWTRLFKKTFVFTGGEIVKEFLMSTGYLPGAHDASCPVFTRVAALHPRWLGEYLNGQGYTVCGIRLNGHATKPEDMIRSRWQDWLLSVEDGYNLLRSCTDQVFLLGLSMGGILSLTTAAQLDVRGVVAMSTPYALPDDWRLKFIGLLSKIKPYMPKNNEGPGSGWFGDAWKQHVSYPQNPLRSIGELSRLLGEMRASLPQITVPVLLIHSRDDDYVIRDSMQKIYAALGTPDKQMMWVEGSGHVITEEPQREKVFAAAANFIQRVSRSV